MTGRLSCKVALITGGAAGQGGADIVAGSPQEFRAFIAAEAARWAKVIKDAGIKIE